MQELLHRVSIVALGSILLLVFVGAIVRATGSGLGCPDWPRCWGCLIPPTSEDQIDVSKLDMERFRMHAVRHGIDPESITEDTILASFDPVRTWIEFVNRLTSLPLGFATLALFVLSFFAKEKRGLIVTLAGLSLLDVLFNGWMGAMVVRSGLKPGIISLHMGLAFLLICLLVTVVWLTQPEEKRPRADRYGGRTGWLLWMSVLFFVSLFVEGILGSQLREQTDELALKSSDLSRRDWVGVLSGTMIFLVHRTFSWALLLLSVLVFWQTRRSDQEVRQARLPAMQLVIVVVMMLMGIVLGHVGVFRVVQVLHVGLTAVLLTATWWWLLDLIRGKRAMGSS